MRNTSKIIIAAAILAAGFTMAPATYAHDSQGSGGSMMGSGTMGQSNMSGMMSMMDQMSQMMNGCNKMMQSMASDHGTGQPSEQLHKDAPSAPGKSE